MKTLRKNQEITALAVRVIGYSGEKLGLMPIEKARGLALEYGTDLVEVSPKATPPVCKVMDYGKYLYKLKKQDQKQKKGMKKTEVKGIRLGLSISDHDMEIKKNQAIGFLKDRNIVKVVTIFRGRELAHKNIGRDKMYQFYDSLREYADIDSPPKHAGYQTVMVLSPRKEKVKPPSPQL